MNTPDTPPIQYYQRFGLDRDPFPIDSIDNILFFTPELKHRIDIIKHLLEFSRQLVLVTGPAESGKTTLCRFLPSSFDQRWIISVSDASELMDPDMLTRISMEEIPADARPGKAGADERMLKYLQFCDRDGKLPLLIIDQGHKLTIETLQFLVRLNALSVNNTCFRILVVADPQIDQTLDDPRIKLTIKGIIHEVGLPLLNISQTAAYLQHRIAACGKVDPYPFTDRDAEHIYKVSGGAPGKINRLACQAMQDPDELAARRLQAEAQNKHNWTPVIITAAVIVITLSLYVLLLQEGDEPRSQPAAADNTLALPVISSDETARPVPDNLAAATTEATPVTDADDLYQAEIDSMTPQTQVTPPAPVQALAPVEAVDAPTALSDMFAGLRGEDWIRAQPANQYVLQLIGARDIKTLEKYLAQVPAIRDQLAVLTTVNNDRPWYVFIYGNYPDRTAAAADLARLPAAARTTNPWPRTLASVQADLEKQ